MKSPCDALIYAQDLAEESPISVSLLYVVNLNIASVGGQAYEELRAESEAALQRLSRYFFGSEQASRLVIRTGIPHQEIVAEAKAESADLIILTGSPDQSWKRFLGQSTTSKIIDASPCPTVVLPRNWKKTHIQRFHPDSHFPTQPETMLSEAA